MAEATPRIDRLSSLPNELLDIIFEFVYRGRPALPTRRQPALAPLSKRLFTFHERFLYREINLAYSTHVDQLRASLESNPRKGVHIKSLYAPSLEEEEEGADVPEFFKSLTSVLSFCVCLEVLDIRPGVSADEFRPIVPEWNMSLLDNASLLQSLPIKRLEVSLAEEEEESSVWLCGPNLDILAFVQEHPTLSELHVYDWDHSDRQREKTTRRFEMPGVRKLRVEGCSAHAESVKGIVEMCPSLVDLSIEAEFLNVTVCDQLLLQFISLRSINLGTGFFSPTIHLILRQLPLLESITLGNGTIDFDGFRSLINGPSRLKNLLQLDIKLFIVFIEFTATACRSGGEERGGTGSLHDGFPWVKPTEEENRWFEIMKGFSGLVDLGREWGIAVIASISKLECYLECYALEAVNRSILEAYYQGDLSNVTLARLVAQGRSWLPPAMDLDNFDPSRLELVETPLPELDWFVLSLKNKDVEAA